MSPHHAAVQALCRDTPLSEAFYQHQCGIWMWHPLHTIKLLEVDVLVAMLNTPIWRGPPHTTLPSVAWAFPKCFECSRRLRSQPEAEWVRKALLRQTTFKSACFQKAWFCRKKHRSAILSYTEWVYNEFWQKNEYKIYQMLLITKAEDPQLSTMKS